MKPQELVRIGRRWLRKLRGRSERSPWQWLSDEDHSSPYLTGNSIASRCRHILNYGRYRANRNGRENWCFVKTDHLERFFERYAPRDRFVLFTHNSDLEITREAHGRFLDDPRVVAWFAINVGCAHPKLFAIPIGLANAGYAHGDVVVLSKVQSEDHPKTQMFYVNFTVGNTKSGISHGREYCLSQIGLDLAPYRDGGWEGFAGGYCVRDTFDGYLRGLARSYFTVSPRGNGIDCHRTWEALYLRSIPIVTRSAITERHRDLPLIVLDDWAEFKTIEFSAQRYRDVWADFDVRKLHVDNYLRHRCPAAQIDPAAGSSPSKLARVDEAHRPGAQLAAPTAHTDRTPRERPASAR
jgi:hypothetical protein